MDKIKTLQGIHEYVYDCIERVDDLKIAPARQPDLFKGLMEIRWRLSGVEKILTKILSGEEWK